MVGEKSTFPDQQSLLGLPNVDEIISRREYQLIRRPRPRPVSHPQNFIDLPDWVGISGFLTPMFFHQGNGKSISVGPIAIILFWRHNYWAKWLKKLEFLFLCHFRIILIFQQFWKKETNLSYSITPWTAYVHVQKHKAKKNMISISVKIVY